MPVKEKTLLSVKKNIENASLRLLDEINKKNLYKIFLKTFLDYLTAHRLPTRPFSA